VPRGRPGHLRIVDVGEEITIATWNTEWITRRSGKFERALERISSLDADILVLTEVTLDLIPAGGHLLLGGVDWGYPRVEGRHKVALWSRWPIKDGAVDLINPPGRSVAGTIRSPIGVVRVHGVCVPWRDAHVYTGRRDSRQWEEHLAFLDSLATTLAKERELGTTAPDHRIILGDINQRGGRHAYGNDEVRTRWEELCSSEHLTPVTPNDIVDKIALSQGLSVTRTGSLAPEGISDHHAVWCEVPSE
jgi:endonuclease/exonuclease/phosphatase family metal-dependent hydrolase